MKIWSEIPFFFRKRILITFLIGTGCAVITLVMFFLTNDRTMLLLGVVIMLLSWLQCLDFGCCAIQKKYKTVLVICRYPSKVFTFRHRKVELVEPSGRSYTLTLKKEAMIQDGRYYRAYFRNAFSEYTGNEITDEILLSDSLIGFEPITEDVYSAAAP